MWCMGCWIGVVLHVGEEVPIHCRVGTTVADSVVWRAVVAVLSNCSAFSSRSHCTAVAVWPEEEDARFQGSQPQVVRWSVVLWRQAQLSQLTRGRNRWYHASIVTSSYVCGCSNGRFFSTCSSSSTDHSTTCRETLPPVDAAAETIVSLWVYTDYHMEASRAGRYSFWRDWTCPQ